MTKQQIEIFETPDGQTQIEVRFERETIWLTQAQMAELFNKDVRTINEHVKNIFKEHELIVSETTIRKFRIVRQEGARQVQREIDHYDLDMVISVGYRVNSKKGTQSIESKAAHLRYFMVKDHPFTDGNKRSGAFLFVDFLHRNRRLMNAHGQPCINDTGLAASRRIQTRAERDNDSADHEHVGI